MSPPNAARRLIAQAPASANEADGSSSKQFKVAAAAAASLAAFSFLANQKTKNQNTTPTNRTSQHTDNVFVDVRTTPGGVIAFNASVPVYDPSNAWQATRKCALGQLTPVTQLTDVTAQKVITKTPSSRLFGGAHDGGAVVTQDAKWSVGPARGVARVTLSATVDDKAQKAMFELVGSDRLSEDFGKRNSKQNSKPKPSPLAAYDGVLGVDRNEVYIKGEACVGVMPAPAKALAAKFAAKVLRRQIKRSLADIARVANA